MPPIRCPTGSAPATMFFRYAAHLWSVTRAAQAPQAPSSLHGPPPVSCANQPPPFVAGHRPEFSSVAGSPAAAICRPNATDSAMRQAQRTLMGQARSARSLCAGRVILQVRSLPKRDVSARILCSPFGRCSTSIFAILRPHPARRHYDACRSFGILFTIKL